MKGKFIVVEGLDGAGKTTSSYAIAAALRQNGVDKIIHTHEPGGTPLAEKLRQLIKKDKHQKEHIRSHTELLMLYAARIQLVENIIKPALAHGTWVIGDRHELSSQAYQGGGHGIRHDFIRRLKKEVMGNFVPDLILYLDVTPAISVHRIKKRGTPDRMETQSLHFFTRVRDYYLTMLKSNNRIKKIDATQSQEKMNADLKDIITKWFQAQKLESTKISLK
ncbi:dTMP kinase [Candidatus Erwinia haradaeae]|uniref:Thymidylate kinase n=1 Tax=Candidatus Erwinia haradaeae TaxID=1922217 RepID=A0A451DA63_9GAMM|nr:dTMP kinase [Candidatus Erwinia haradaeae]VFP83205.1 Thymidylate kinase [Candidatus Erwinia haradaeae]